MRGIRCVVPLPLEASRLSWKVSADGLSLAAEPEALAPDIGLEVLSVQGAKERLLRDLLRAEKEEMWQRLMDTGFRGSFCFVFLSGVS